MNQLTKYVLNIKTENLEIIYLNTYFKNNIYMILLYI